MSTPASPLSVQDFAARIRTKYPGAYDNLPDNELATRVVAKHPEYKDKVALGAATGSQGADSSQGQGASGGSGLTWSTQVPEAQRSFLGRMFSPENIARSSEPQPQQPGESTLGWVFGKSIPAAAVRAAATPISLLRGPTNEQEAGLNFSAGYPALLAQRLFGPSAETARKTKQAASETADAWRSQSSIPGAAKPLGPPALRTAGYAAATAVPIIGPGIANIVERAGHDPAGALSDVAMNAELGGGMKEAGARAESFLTPGLTDASHTILGNAATKVKQTVGQGGPVHQAISQHFQKLANDVIAADYASGKKIPMNDIWEEALKHADDYAAGKTTPKFNAIVDEIQKRPVELTWKELHDLQQNVDKVTSSASEGTRDAGAASQMRAAIARKLDDKAAEVGRGDQWNAAKTIWRTLKEYQGDGVLSKLLNTGTDPVSAGGVAEGGKNFFDILRDPENRTKLNEINKGFEAYGLPKDYFKSVADTHAPLHDYLLSQQGTMSRLKLVAKHPVSALPGLVLGGGLGMASGTPMGGFLGSTAGALAGVRGAARWRATGALEKLGGVPEVSSPLTEASKVQPIGSGEKPIAPKTAGAVDLGKLTKDMQSLGYEKAEAQRRAKLGIEQHPTDLKAATDVAIRGQAAKVADIAKVKSVSGGSQTSQRGTYSRDPRTQEQILSSLQELKGSQKKGATIESRAEPMGPKSIASHNDAFAEAKREWQSANPGKDPATHMSEIARRAEQLRKGK